MTPYWKVLKSQQLFLITYFTLRLIVTSTVFGMCIFNSKYESILITAKNTKESEDIKLPLLVILEQQHRVHGYDTRTEENVFSSLLMWRVGGDWGWAKGEESFYISSGDKDQMDECSMKLVGLITHVG